MSEEVQHMDRATKAALFFGQTTLGMGLTIMFVVVPPLGRAAGLDEIDVSLILSVSALFYAFMTPVSARLAERFGRKRIIVFSLTAAGATNIIFGAAIWMALEGMIPAAWVLASFMIARILFGVLAPGLSPAAMAMVADASDAKSRAAALGTLGAAMGLGSILGPGLAAGIAPLGRVAPIWAVAGLSLIAAVIAAAYVKEVRAKPPENGEPAPSLPVLHPTIAPVLVLIMMYFIVIAGFQQTFAFLMLDHFKADAATATQYAGIGFSVIALSSLVTQFAYVNVIKPPPALMLRRGLFLVMISFFALAVSSEFWMMCIALAVAGIGGANAIPGANAMASLRAPAGLQGAAAGLMMMAPPAGFVTGPILGALLYQVDIHLPLWFGAVACALLFAMSWRLRAPGAGP